MPETKKRRARERDYVFVELKPGEREKLTALKDRREAETGERYTLAGTFRWLLAKEKYPKKVSTGA